MMKRISVLALLLCLFALPALAVDAHENHDGWTAINAVGSFGGDSQTEDMYFYLSGDVTRSASNDVINMLNFNFAPDSNCTVYLCLNGKQIKARAGDAIRVTNGSIVLCDCVGSGIITHVAGYGGGVRVRDGNMTMYGGTIKDNKATGSTYGGGVDIEHGDMTMYGGTISGNKGYLYGGGVRVLIGNMTMHGGTISGNWVEGGGGGVRVDGGTVTMYGGTISDNSTDMDGGGVRAGKMVMYGGTISGNSAEDLGGGVDVDNMTMHGGTISGNMAGFSGGGAYIENMTMTGGAITGNKMTGNGSSAGVYLENGMTVSGNVKITGNTKANGEPGNVYLTGETIVLAGPLGEDAEIGVTPRKLEPGQSVVYMEAAEGETVSEADMAKMVSDNGYTQWIRNGAAEMYVAGVFVQEQPARRGTASGGGAYQPGDTVILTAEATVPGFGFVGWYQDDMLVSAENPYVFALETVAEEFTARFEMIEYTLTYHLNGGKYPEGSEGNPASYTVRTSSFTLVNPEKENYIFLGWEESGELKKTVRIGSGSTGDRVFKAKWAPVEYAITYILPEGTDNSANPKVYTVETPTFTLAAPTKPGYTFMGWIETEGGKPQLNVTIEQGSTGERTFEAVFEMSEYALTYDLDGGAYPAGSAGNPASYTVATESFTLVNPEKENYTFLGWEENGELRKVVTIEKGSTGDRVFKAKYGPVEYAITYILPKGADNSANPAAYTVETPTFTLAAPTKPGYMFMGWIETEGGKPQLNVTIEQGSTGERTFEAVFKELPPLPQTGDNSSLMLSAALLALSGAGFAAMRRKRRAE